MSFQGQRYLTKGVQTTIPLELQLFMWKLIEELSEPKDYLQVFRLSVSDNGNQHIIHEQEEPAPAAAAMILRIRSSVTLDIKYRRLSQSIALFVLEFDWLILCNSLYNRCNYGNNDYADDFVHNISLLS